MQQRIRAAEFYLQESIRPGTDWSISPVGLSSSGYGDHIFWDAETWMYPSPAAAAPGRGLSVVNYRSARWPAPANAQQTGYQGAGSPGRAQRRDRADADLGGDPRPRAAHHRRRRPRAVAVLPRHRRHRGWRAKAGRCSRAPRTSGPAGRPPTATAATPSTASKVPTSTTSTSTTRSTPTSAPSPRCGSPPGPPRCSARRPTPPGRRSPTGCRCCSTRHPGPPGVRGYTGDQIKQADVVMLTYPWEWAESQTIGLERPRLLRGRTDPDGPR